MKNKKKIYKNDFNHLKDIILCKKVCNYGFMVDTIPPEFVEECETLYQEYLKDNTNFERHNDHLAGEIEHECVVSFSKNFIDYLIDLCKYFEIKSGNYIKFNSFSEKYLHGMEDEFKDIDVKKIKNYNLPALKPGLFWMNLQKKYEFNPTHNHTGIMSFVIWHRIPYTVAEERQSRPNKYKKDRDIDFPNGSFMFQYTLDDEIASTMVANSSEYENVIAIFPSNLRHIVYPFYSTDEFRVTFSGNLYFDRSQADKII